MRLFFKFIRFVLGRVILAWDALVPPRQLPRTPAERERIARETAGWAMYEFRACPFCVKTRRAMRRLGVAVELRDALGDESSRNELREGGGQIQVPCLRIPAGAAGRQDRWLYESSEIIRFLEERFPPARA